MQELQEIEFPSGRDTLRGWLVLPEGDGPFPALVMAHGLSALKEQDLDRYAARFAAGGLACIVFDHPCFGASDGEPRQEADPERQVAGYQAALDFAQHLPDVCADRLGAWGTSFSGGHVIELAARDERIRCAVAQVPNLGRDESPAPTLAEALAADRAARARGEPARLVPVVGPAPDSVAYFADAPSHYRNEVTVASIGSLYRPEPGTHARNVKVPLLLIAARTDSLIPIDRSRRVASELPSGSEYVELDCGHYAVYRTHFEVAAARALEFCTRHLLAS